MGAHAELQSVASFLLCSQIPEKNPHWIAVPEFGGWDQKAPGDTDYSVVFSQARANRKQHKTSFSSLGNEKELLAATSDQQPEEDPVVRKRKILTYINCCIRP